MDLKGLPHSNGKYAAHITVGYFDGTRENAQQNADDLVKKVKKLGGGYVILGDKYNENGHSFEATLYGFKPHIEDNSRCYQIAACKKTKKNPNPLSVLHVDCASREKNKQYFLDHSSARVMCIKS